jgi:TIR domain-containing protein/Leucine Rich Repeat (LRR) protein
MATTQTAPDVGSEAVTPSKPIRVFLSYARDDASEVEALGAQLKENNVDVLMDVKEILALEEWRRRLEQMIIAADAVIFCLSPSSARSNACRWEADMAERFGKRIAPVVIKPLGEASPPEVIGRINYIFLVGAMRTDVRSIVSALQTDIGWVREHTRLSELATSWANAGRPRNRLLQGTDIRAAELWERNNTQASPVVTTLLREYIRGSRQWYNLRNYLYSFGVILLAASVGIGIYVWHRQAPLMAVKAINDVGGSVQRMPDGLYVTVPSNARDIGSLARSMATLDSIVEIDLAESGIDDHNSSFLAQQKRLKRINLKNNAIGNDGLRNLSTLENVEELTLEATRVTDDGLQSLSKMSKLRYLNLTGTNVTGKGLAALASSTRLKTLILDHTATQLGNLEGLPFAKTLQTLSLEWVELTDDDLPKLAGYSKLNELYLDNNPLHGHSLEKLADMHLSFLGLSSTKLDRDGFRALEKLQFVEDVGLKSTELDDEGFRSVCKMNLTVLRIPDTKVTDDGFSCASKFKELTAIYIGGTNLSVKAIRSLSNLDNVSELFFPTTPINDDIIDILLTMKELKKVWVINSAMSLSGISRLKQKRPELTVNTGSNIDG